MKIVIDMPNNDYEYIKGLNEGITDYHTTVKLYIAVRGGTVLPKGHGDLIDRDKLEKDTEWNEYEDGFISYSHSQIF